MKKRISRVATGLVALAVAGAVAATSSYAISREYNAQVTHDHGTGGVGFNLDRTAGGDRKVVQFAVFRIEFSCKVGTPGRTGTMKLKDQMPVHDDGTFEGKGEVVGIPADPHGKVTGKLKHGGKTEGTLRLTGELDGNSGSDCDTGHLEWKGQKTGL